MPLRSKFFLLYYYISLGDDALFSYNRQMERSSVNVVISVGEWIEELLFHAESAKINCSAFSVLSNGNIITIYFIRSKENIKRV